MSFYTKTIGEAIRRAGRTDRDDEATAKLVEELMRCDRTGLDGIPPVEFDREVRAFLAAMDQLPGFARDYCEALDITVPEWAKAEPVGATK